MTGEQAIVSKDILHEIIIETNIPKIRLRKASQSTEIV
jgi:hypothetical protein